MGKGLQIDGRFSITMGEATIQGLKITAKQATIAQTLKQGGKQFVSVGMHHITKSVPAEAYIGLGIDFIRSADPGFELLASGGLKGINSLKDATIKLNQKNHPLTPLVEALEKQVKNLPQTAIKSFKIETAYRPELKKEVLVVNIGKKQNKDIFVQINSVSGALYGQKYHRDGAGNLALAPVRLQEHLYYFKTQSLGGKGSKMAALNWRTEENASASKKIQKARNEGIRALK
ncbi:hypothetical protein [Arsenophonus endosymbiont of Aleurodicus floccissimus]|uniref:hypothetical protein n=1 Tax=Arsenophonus endosymbiont of Aleurodicus floccissimus TaxID=2152761 RepID=UPI000E6B1A1C|nr:hypothetical protein [Arsenophonus endosymbiont of Aleurodicus floccissimus]